MIDSIPAVPPDDDRGTYADRALRIDRVTKREQWEGKDGPGCSITGEAWTAICSQEIYDLLPEGKEFIQETRNFNWITGWVIDGKWYERKTDEELEAERAAQRFEWEERKRRQLEANREEWQRRQDALPEWVRSRLENFHERSGGKFAADGWGYELVVAELAVEYAKMGAGILDKDVFSVEDTVEIKRISHEQGTSGNQHSMALALAKAHLSEPERLMNDTVSALSPITGDAFYEGDEG
jgi:hypothetical protein